MFMLFVSRVFITFLKTPFNGLVINNSRTTDAKTWNMVCILTRTYPVLYAAKCTSIEPTDLMQFSRNCADHSTELKVRHGARSHVPAYENTAILWWALSRWIGNFKPRHGKCVVNLVKLSRERLEELMPLTRRVVARKQRFVLLRDLNWQAFMCHLRI